MSKLLQDAQPFRPPWRLFRLGKYLIPIDFDYWTQFGFPSPTTLSTLSQMLKDYPSLVTRDVLLPDRPEGPVEHLIIRGGEIHPPGPSRSFKSTYPNSDCSVYVIREGGSVGRNGCLLGPGNSIVAETGFYLDDDELAKSMTCGRLHPHYWRYRKQGDLRNRSSLPWPRRVAGSVAALNNRCSHNYFHWMLEIAPRIVAMSMVGIKPNWYLIDCQSRFQKQVLKLLGVSDSQLIQPNCYLHLVADELIYVSEPTPRVLRQFSKSLKSQLSISETERNRRLYISRRKARHRKVTNEPAVERFLESQGFESHCLEDYPVTRQFQLIAESKVIVTTHGAALANSVFAQPGTNIIELFPSRRINLELYPNVSRVFSLRHQSVIVESSRFLQSVRIDERDLELALRQCQTDSSDNRNRNAA